VSVEGSSDSLSQLIDRLAAQLLARAAGEPEERLPALASVPAPALREYLDGWTLFRRGARRDAIASFERAVAADSSFALAALGAARAIYDSDRFRSAPSVVLAWQLRGRLTPADLAYLTAFLGPRYPEASTPREFQDALERTLQLSPTHADAWMWYGVWVCADQNSPDMPARCRAATLRALALDSLSTITVGEAVERYQRLRDTSDLRRALQLYLGLDSTSPTSAFLQWSTATTLGDSVGARRLALSDSMVSTLVDGDLGPMWRMVTFCFREGLGFDDLDAALGRTLAISPTEPQRAVVARVRFRVATARGRASGVPHPPGWPAGYSNYRRVMDALFADADPNPATAAAAILEQGLGSPMKHGCCLEQFAAAQAALAAGRLTPARRAMADIHRFRATNPEVRTFELVLAAQIAAGEDSPVRAAALARLDSAMVDWRDWMGASLIYGNLIAARLHEERHEYAAAQAALRRRSELAWSDAELVTYHREEGRMAALAGDTAGAVVAYRKYLGIRANAEPRLQAQVDSVRAALHRLQPSTASSHGMLTDRR
jgi:serine/threonine-protein kinase